MNNGNLVIWINIIDHLPGWVVIIRQEKFPGMI